jgi:hypothetical protein
MNRWKRLVNMALLALIVIVTGSGWLAFGTGSEAPSKIITGVHGAAGLGLLLFFRAKFRIVRWGLRSAERSHKVIGMTLVALVLLTTASGLLHMLGGWRTYLGLLPMQIHVGAASAAIPLTVAHVLIHHRLRRRRRPLLRRTDLDRRAALAAAGTVVGSAALWLVVPALPRRGTGSHEIGSPEVGSREVVGASIEAVPVTQWLFDSVPRIPPADWRLRIGPLRIGPLRGGPPRGGPPGPGPARGRELDLDAVAALPQRRLRAVLDCTGGWWTEQEWTGVPLTALGLAELGLPPGASIEVVSATGYRRRFPVGEADSLLLATHAGGRPRSAGHGGPARLVAPGRRGFHWVKWVTSLDVVDEPSWWQPPFPLQ